MTQTYPVIDLDSLDLSAVERDIVAAALLPDGTLRASKPVAADGDGKYTWRMLAFGLSPNPKHHCLPVMAEFDIEVDDHAERRARAKDLDRLAQLVEESIPVEERHGTLRWAGLMGVA